MASKYINLPVIGLMPHQMEYMIERQNITGNAFASKIRDLVQNDMDDIHVPEFLLEMSRQMNAQHNRSTADPIWQVCYDEKVPAYSDCGDFVEWVYTGDGGYDIVFSNEKDTKFDNDYATQFLIDKLPAFCKTYFDEEGVSSKEFKKRFEFSEVDEFELPEGICEYPCSRERKIVKVCLTENDANCFIRRKQHDYPHLYTYVESMVFCPQMIELRQWIMGLTK